MSTHKHIDLICVIVLVLTLILTVLFINGERFGLRPMSADELSEDDSSTVTATDRNGAWETGGATQIFLLGETARVSGGGAYFHEGTVTISSGGRYVLSGTLDNGSIFVNAGSGSKVWLMLDGAHISCEDDACLCVEQADKLILSLAEGSENSMISGAQYRDEALQAGHDGAIFSRDDLSINGAGSLSVSAGYRHGIVANDDLVIAGGSLSVSAARDAVHANDSLSIENADLSLLAGDNGMEVNTEGGLLHMASGSLTIDSEGDSIHAAGDITLDGGSLDIRSGDDAVHADGALSVNGGSLTVRDCYEGLEALVIDIRGGTAEIRCRDDGLNAIGGTRPVLLTDPDAEPPAPIQEKGDIRLSGGSVTVICESGRKADGLDAGGDILISGGSLLVSMVNNRGNCALDCGTENGGVCRITGGTVIALDAGGMTEPPDGNTDQCAVLCDLGTGRGAGATLRLEDSAGRELLRVEAPCSFSCVLLSSGELRQGESCRLFIDGIVRQLDLTDTVTVVGR